MRVVASFVLGLVIATVGFAGAGILAFTLPHRSTTRHETAWILRPEATRFEAVPSGFDPHLAPSVSEDGGQLTVVASGRGGEYASVRWNGSAFVPGPPPRAQLPPSEVKKTGMYLHLHDDRWLVYPVPDFEEPMTWEVRDHGIGSAGPPLPPGQGPIDEVVELPSGRLVFRTALGRVFVARVDDATVTPIVLPGGVPRTILGAGRDRVLILPPGNDTRTWFVDAGTGAVSSGPPVPNGPTWAQGSDINGTVGIFPGEIVEELQVGWLGTGGALVLVAGVGSIGVLAACAQGSLSFAAAFAGGAGASVLLVGAVFVLARLLQGGVW